VFSNFSISDINFYTVLQSKKYRLLFVVLVIILVSFLTKYALPVTSRSPNVNHVTISGLNHMTSSIISVVAPIMEPSIAMPISSISEDVPIVPRRTFQAGSAVRIDRKRYVCPTFGPRLGNLMFLYASNYGIAFDNNMTLALSIHDLIYPLIPTPVIKGRFALCALSART